MDDVADPRVRPVRSCDDQHLRRHGVGELLLKAGEKIRRIALCVNEDTMGQAASLKRGPETPLKVAQQTREDIFPAAAANNDGDVTVDHRRSAPAKNAATGRPFTGRSITRCSIVPALHLYRN